MDFSTFSKEDITVLKKLNSAYKIQEFVEKLDYSFDTRCSPLNVLRNRRGDCLEGAVFASAAFIFNGIDSFLVDLRAVRDEDHVLSVYKINKKYGSVAKSKFLNLGFRPPVYNSVRELVLSYFWHYFNFFGELTLRGYSVPLWLDEFWDGWHYDDRIMPKIEDRLDEIRHFSILGNGKRLPVVEPVKFWSEIRVLPKTRIGKRYLKHRESEKNSP